MNTDKKNRGKIIKYIYISIPLFPVLDIVIDLKVDTLLTLHISISEK
jgi:hypothetical protein